jgi:IS5 family transposase
MSSPTARRSKGDPGGLQTGSRRFAPNTGVPFYSASNEAAAHERGVKRVCIPNRSTKSAERRRERKKRWFKDGQRWRTGCEGRISVRKRRHGLRRCAYRGGRGMQRWVGLGVIADNLHHPGAVLAERKN